MATPWRVGEEKVMIRSQLYLAWGVVGGGAYVSYAVLLSATPTNGDDVHGRCGTRSAE